MFRANVTAPPSSIKHHKMASICQLVFVAPCSPRALARLGEYMATWESTVGDLDDDKRDPAERKTRPLQSWTDVVATVQDYALSQGHKHSWTAIKWKAALW